MGIMLKGQKKVSRLDQIPLKKRSRSKTLLDPFMSFRNKIDVEKRASVRLEFQKMRSREGGTLNSHIHYYVLP
jgi:hypothetical protein